MHAHTHTHTRERAHTHTHTHAHTHTHTHTQTWSRPRTRSSGLTDQRTHKRTSAHALTHARARAHTRTHSHAHTLMHSHLDTDARTRILLKPHGPSPVESTAATSAPGLAAPLPRLHGDGASSCPPRILRRAYAGVPYLSTARKPSVAICTAGTPSSAYIAATTAPPPSSIDCDGRPTLLIGLSLQAIRMAFSPHGPRMSQFSANVRSAQQ